MLDKNGYRLNVGMVICNGEGKVFWGKRYRASGWQFPQGGLHDYETLQEAMFRELREEVGLKKSDIEILGRSRHWVRYLLPNHLRRKHQHPFCIGQKQHWFLLRLKTDDTAFNLKTEAHQEFESWKWVDYWYPLKEVVYFKKRVYTKVLKELEKQLHANISKS